MISLLTKNKIKMKFAYLIIYFLLGVSLISCIQEEAPNAEADILTCTVEADILKMDPKIENSKITLMIKPNIDLTNIVLNFTLTPGATIYPLGGTPQDFSDTKEHPVIYTVTSEDGKWEKKYTVNCSVTGISTVYDFEYYELGENKYYTYYEIFPENKEKQYIWASGNSGYAIVGGKKGPEEYPTVPYDFGKSGKCLKLETRSTGDLGAMVNMRIAAGNLFIGDFKALDAMQDALKATHFGVPFDFIPIALVGYYKYKRGEVFTEKDGSVNPDVKDNFDIYSILYETDESVKYLDGTNFLTSPNLISIARIGDKEKKETNEWIRFELPFVYQNGKSIDMQKLEEGRYNVAIVFSSSIEGDRFRGAVGSQLLIDEVELIHENNK